MNPQENWAIQEKLKPTYLKGELVESEAYQVDGGKSVAVGLLVVLITAGMMAVAVWASTYTRPTITEDTYYFHTKDLPY